MIQNSKMSLNFEQININDPFSKEFNFQSLDHSVFPFQNFHFINSYGNNAEDINLNDYFFAKKSALSEEEINKSKLIENHTNTKACINEKKINKNVFFIKK